MRRVTLTDLADLTGKTWRTVRGRLHAAGVEPIARDNRSDLYDSAAALAALYEVDRVASEALDLTAERAALARAQRLKIETDEALRARELLRAAEVADAVTSMILAARARLLAIEGQIGQQLPQDVAPAAREIVRRKVHEALDELAEWNPEGAHG